MSKHRELGESRLSQRSLRDLESPKQQEKLVSADNDFVQISAILKRSDTEWLDKTVGELRRVSPRGTSKSEVIRIALAQLQKLDKEELYELLG